MFYFLFEQMNPSGFFVSCPERGVGNAVIVEAATAQQASDRFEALGEDFETECSCCGPRWLEADPRDAYSLDQAISYVIPEDAKRGVYVHPLNGPFYLHTSTQEE